MARHLQIQLTPQGFAAIAETEKRRKARREQKVFWEAQMTPFVVPETATLALLFVRQLAQQTQRALEWRRFWGSQESPEERKMS